VYIPRLMLTVTTSCDEEEWPQNSSQNLHPWCTTLMYSMITILLLNLQTNKCIPLPNFSQFTSLTC
jgi:hypothetical protein